MRKAIFIFLLTVFPLRAQELLPFTENFTKAEYGGENQVWSVAQGADHAMYFANNRYLLRYNGVVWDKYSLPDRTIIRSIFADGDRIYCGSYKEFGYWKRTDGQMRYASLSGGQRLFEGISGNEEVWKIFRYDGEIYFQSFNELYVYGKAGIRKIRLPSQISYCYVVGKTLYAASVTDGLLRMENGQFVPAIGGELQNNVIHHVEQIGQTLYIFTKNNGLFLHEAGRTKPWDNRLNGILKREVIVTAKFVADHTMIVGTSLNGLYLVDLATGTWQNLNRQNAIRNNTVLSIATDRENDLWLGLDNGIAHVEISSPVRIFSDNSGALGSVYDISTSESGYLLATNHGVFKTSAEKLEVISGSQGQVWDIFKDGDRFIIGHNDGTFRFDHKSIVKENDVNGGWQFFYSPYDRVYFQANYSGIAVYRDKNDLSSFKKLPDLTKPIRQIGQDRRGELWAADNYRGLYRIGYDANFNTIFIDNVTQKSGIGNDYDVRLFRRKGETRFLIANRCYVYDRKAAKLVVDKALESELGSISEIVQIGGSQFMAIKNGILYLISEKQSGLVWQSIPGKYYQGKLVSGHTKIYPDGDRLLVNLDDGFLAFGRNLRSTVLNTVSVEVLRDNHLVNINLKLRYNEPVTIHAVPARYGFGRPDLCYRLNDAESYFKLSSGRVTLNNLESGSQELAIFSMDGNRLREITRYRFTVGYPWYFSFWMILVYVSVIALAGWLYFRWNQIRYRQKLALREEEIRHQRDMEAVENELRIQEYEKHILELEIQSKSTEVAGKSFSIAKQAEVMANIRKILDRELDIDKLKAEIKRAIRTNTIEKHEWEAFETNMKQIHSEFVTRLVGRHPELSSKDIRLSMYLRMNLSSKEIAPLMNISFRGVELHRYRLRKKLQLPTESPLNKYMMEI